MVTDRDSGRLVTMTVRAPRQKGDRVADRDIVRLVRKTGAVTG
jgi:hypothetical protein